jgi:hypothetical protein
MGARRKKKQMLQIKCHAPGTGTGRYQREHERHIDDIVRREMEALNPQELKLKNFLPGGS